MRVQAFKFGPDFSENALFEEATGRMTVNIDPWTVPKDCLLACIHRYTDECDIALLDGCGGLFDQRWDNGTWSTAEISKLLSAPVVLVLDAAPLGQSIAAIVKGFENFDKKVKMAGIVLNKVTGEVHTNVLTSSLKKAGIRSDVLGWIQEESDVMCLEDWVWGGQNRLKESVSVKSYAESIERVKKEISVEKLIEVASFAKVPRCPENTEVSNGQSEDLVQVKIAVAKDAAFSFYFHENFIMLEAAKAELVFFSPLEDEELPTGCSGLYFGGGNLERHTPALAANKSLMASIRAFAKSGGVIYAEGSGLLYLSESVQLAREFPQELVGIFPFRTRMMETPSSEGGYVEVEIKDNCNLFSPGSHIKGHICNRSQIIQEIVRSALGNVDCHSQNGYDFAYSLHFEGTARPSIPEGYACGNVLASYVHMQFASCKTAAADLVSVCKTVNLSLVSEEVKKASKLAKQQIVETPKSKRIYRRNLSIEEPEKRQLRNVASFDKIMSKLEDNSTNGSVSDNLDSSTDSLKSQGSINKSFKRSESIGCLTNVTISNYVAKQSDKEISPVLRKKREFRLNLTFDDEGSETTTTTKAKKTNCNDQIVCMSPSGVEMLCALGLEKRLVGVTNLCNYPEGVQKGRVLVAQTKFDVSGLGDGRIEMKLKDFWCRKESAFVIDSNFLRRERPGLVIVEEGGDPDGPAVEAALGNKKGSFGGLGPVAHTAILSHKCPRLSEIFEFMLKIGQAAGTQDSSQVIVDELRSRIAKIGSIVSCSYPCERVVVLTCLNPLTVGGYWIPEMVVLAGGEPHGARSGNPHQRISWQDLKNLEPEVLIVAAASWEETKQELAQLAGLPGWWGLPAMKTGQLYVCDNSLFTTAGPRLVDGIELLARIMHPSLAGQYGKSGMAWSCMLRNGHRCRACNLARQFCALL